MNCLTCSRSGAPQPAVALCPHCYAGLCLTHVTETANAPAPGGMRLTCGHDTWATAWQQAAQGRHPQASSVTTDR